jgi:flagellar hook-associated protein 2
MATISSRTSTASSSLQSYVYNLMAADRKPLATLTTQKSDLQSKLQVYSALGTRMSSLLTLARAFAAPGGSNPLSSVAVSGNDAAALDVSADSTAQTGSYSVEVRRLANRQTIASDPVEAGVPAQTTGKDEKIPPARFRIAAGGRSFDVSVEIPAGATMETALARIAQGVNAAKATVTASVLKAGAGKLRLLLQPKDTGSAAAVTSIEDVDGRWMRELGLTSPKGKNASGFQEIQAANDALVLIDGVEVTSSSNLVQDVLPGVTLTLKAAGASGTITVARDQDAIVKQVQDFITEYNKTVDEIRKDTAGGDESGSNRGPLTGEVVFSRLRISLREAVDQVVVASDPSVGATSVMRLSQLGISFDREGHLSMGDGRKLRAGLDGDPGGAEAVFRSAGQRVADLLNSYGKAGGVLARQRDSAGARIRSLDARISQANQTLAKREEALTAQLAQLQSGIGLLQSQQGYLSGILSSSDSLFA